MLNVANEDLIACLGPKLTYSYIAAKKIAPELGIIDSSDCLCCDSIPEVVNKVSSGEAGYGLIPYWNSNKHRIIEGICEIIKKENICIVDNFKMDIDICLVSQANNLTEVTSVTTIKHILKQFSQYCSSDKMKEIAFKEAGSTIKGIEAALLDASTSAVCSLRTAKEYEGSLNILDTDIQNKPNGTLFFVIKRSSAYDRCESENHTLLTYPLLDGLKTKDKVTGLLVDKLIFSTNEWAISFDQQKWAFLEVSGHANDMQIFELLDGLMECSDSRARILGCYKANIQKVLDGICRFDSK